MKLLGSIIVGWQAVIVVGLFAVLGTVAVLFMVRTGAAGELRIELARVVRLMLSWRASGSQDSDANDSDEDKPLEH